MPIFSLGDCYPWRYPVRQALPGAGLRCVVHTTIVSMFYYSVQALFFFSTLLFGPRTEGQSFFKMCVDLFPFRPQASCLSFLQVV